MKKLTWKKYVTTQLEHYGTYGIEITRAGFMTNDPELIEKLESHSDFNTWYFLAPTEEQVEKSAKDWAREVLKNEPEPIEVEPITSGNIDDELEALAEQEEIKAEQLAAEEEQKRLKVEKDLNYKDRFRPNAAAEKRAKVKAKQSE